MIPPSSPEIAALAQEASSLQRRGQNQQAEVLYLAALEKDPNDVACLQSLALLLAQQGRFADAEPYFRRVVEHGGPTTAAYNNLGNVLALLHRQREAAECYRAALAIDGNYAEAHNNLGIALASLGKLDEAIAHYKRAIEIRPKFANAHNNLGNALAAENRLGNAIECYQRALQLNANYAEAHSNLGVAFNRVGRTQDSIAHFQRALQISPNFADAYNHLGGALETLGRADEALPLVSRALALAPENPEVYNNFGNVLKALNRHDEALNAYKKAIELRPGYAQAFSNLGDALRERGDAIGARQAYEKAIQSDAHQPRYYYRRLSDTKRFTDVDYRQLLTILDRADELPVNEQVELYFALARAADDLGEKKDSFQYLIKGNAIHRARIDYRETETLELFSRIERVFTPEFMRSKHGHGDDSDVPIFVVGMIRSGTTLVEQILASHPRVHGAGERLDFARLTASYRNPYGSFPESCRGYAVAELTRLGTEYVSSLRTASPSALRIIDKMPANYRLLGLINLTLPNARIIHLRRDALDTCVSCFSILFAGEQPFTYDLAELGRYYRAYDHLMQHWRTALPKGVMLELDYENLIEDVEGHARQIVAHVNLPWSDDCIRFFENPRPVRTASALQVRRPAYKTSVGRWQPYGKMLAPLLQALNMQ